MTIETQEPGLRERKRLATRRAIQLAAVEIALEQGVDRVTVDEISRVADVSPRTFFNYFQTKEAALVGDGPQVPGEDEVAAFVAATHQSIFSGIARLLRNAIELAGEDHELTSARRVLLKQHPQLFALRMLTMRHFEDELQVVVDRRLATDGVPAGPARVSRARLVTLVAFAGMRHAWACWADEGGGTDLGVRLDESFAQLEDLFA